MRQYKYKITDEMAEVIRENWKLTNKNIAKILTEQFGISISETCVIKARNRYGIRKSGLSGRFKKGHVSSNKGLKQTDYMSAESIEKCKQTWFRKGQTARNLKPVGCERFAKDGYVLVKVAEPSVWRLKQQVLYEQYHGVKVKKTDLITFLDGNKYNFSKENLMLISKADNMNMNHLKMYSKDPEITKCGLAVVRLKRKLKEKQK